MYANRPIETVKQQSVQIVTVGVFILSFFNYRSMPKKHTWIYIDDASLHQDLKCIQLQ